MTRHLYCFIVFVVLFVFSLSAQNECPEWTIGEWSACVYTCGEGMQTRIVDCYCNGNLVADSNCDSPKPATTQVCSGEVFNWVSSPFGACSETCGIGTRTRTVICANSGGNMVDDCNCDENSKPNATESCNTITYEWVIGNYGICEIVCGEGTQTRTVQCVDCNGDVAQDNLCTGSKPATTQTCTTSEVFSWTVGVFGACMGDCGAGVKTRTVFCESSLNGMVDDCNCLDAKPTTEMTCYIPGCGIGIGVESPMADLHLNGTLRLQTGTEGIGKVLVSDESGNATWQELPSASLLDITDMKTLMEALPPEAMLTVTDQNGESRIYANSSLLILHLVDKIDKLKATVDQQESEIQLLKKKE